MRSTKSCCCGLMSPTRDHAGIAAQEGERSADIARQVGHEVRLCLFLLLELGHVCMTMTSPLPPRPSDRDAARVVTLNWRGDARLAKAYEGACAATIAHGVPCRDALVAPSSPKTRSAAGLVSTSRLPGLPPGWIGRGQMVRRRPCCSGPRSESAVCTPRPPGAEGGQQSAVLFLEVAIGVEDPHDAYIPVSGR